MKRLIDEYDESNQSMECIVKFAVDCHLKYVYCVSRLLNVLHCTMEMYKLFQSFNIFIFIYNV